MPLMITACLGAAGRATALGLGLALLAGAAQAGPIEGTPPYPPSPYITQLDLDWASYRRDAPGSDNWPTTWAADGNVYTSWGDGGGFGPGAAEKAYVAIGIARLTGSSPATVTGRNLIGGLDPAIAACVPPLGDRIEGNHQGRPCSKKGVRAKTMGMLALGDQAYMFFSPGSSGLNYAEARLRAWTIGTNTWRRASWAFTRNDAYPLIDPALLQAGKGYADIGDYVYAYAPRYAPVDPTKLSIQKGPGGGQIALLRAPKKADLLDRASWQFFAGPGGGRPLWTSNQGAAKPAFVDPAGVGWAVSATYVKALGRYLLLSEHGTSFAGYLGLFEAPGPAGPWHTVAYFRLPVARVGLAPTQYLYNFLAGSFSADGRRFTLVFTGQRTPQDSINLVGGSLTVNPAAR